MEVLTSRLGTMSTGLKSLHRALIFVYLMQVVSQAMFHEMLPWIMPPTYQEHGHALRERLRAWHPEGLVQLDRLDTSAHNTRCERVSSLISWLCKELPRRAGSWSLPKVSHVDGFGMSLYSGNVPRGRQQNTASFCYPGREILYRNQAYIRDGLSRAGRTTAYPRRIYRFIANALKSNDSAKTFAFAR